MLVALVEIVQCLTAGWRELGMELYVTSPSHSTATTSLAVVQTAYRLTLTTLPQILANSSDPT